MMLTKTIYKEKFAICYKDKLAICIMFYRSREEANIAMRNYRYYNNVDWATLTDLSKGRIIDSFERKR